MSTVSTHVLDTANGRPAAGVGVTLEVESPEEGWSIIGSGVTNEDGRVQEIAPGGTISPGIYRITFGSSEYWRSMEVESFYPYASIVFEVMPEQAEEHFHVPLLISPWGYSTYRGS